MENFRRRLLGGSPGAARGLPDAADEGSEPSLASSKLDAERLAKQLSVHVCDAARS